jgi:hypothetical protein
VNRLKIFQLILLPTFFSVPALAVLGVEWYPPEIESGTVPDRSKVSISGRTVPNAEIHIDGESVTMIKAKAAPTTGSMVREARMSCKVYLSPNLNSKVVSSLSRGAQIKSVEFSATWFKVLVGKSIGYVSLPCLEAPPTVVKIGDGQTRSNFEGFFEVAMELPPGLSQMPVEVTAPNKEQKTFLITVDVNPVKEEIKTTNPVSLQKPPAASKKFRIWGGAGFTYQTFTQKAAGDLNFQTVQAPGWVARGGYWGDQWGLDLYVRDAPGKIEATAPYQVQSNVYHWRTIDAKGLYQFHRGPNSRLFGLPSQWQLRYGGELQQIPFLSVGANSSINIEQHSLTMGMIGVGLLLGQERDWSYEAAVGYQHTLSAKAEGGQTLTLSSPLAYEIQLGAAYKFAPGWRLGVFSYLQSLSYNYSLLATDGTVATGTQKLFYTTLDLRLGYEF